MILAVRVHQIATIADRPIPKISSCPTFNRRYQNCPFNNASILIDKKTVKTYGSKYNDLGILEGCLLRLSVSQNMPLKKSFKVKPPMPLPNDPYPNKIDLVYAISADLVDKARKRLTPLKLSKERLKDIIEPTQVEPTQTEPASNET